MTRRFPLHVHISTLFITLILLVGGVIGGLGYMVSHDILESTASEINTRIGRETVSEFSNIIGPAEMATRLLSYDGITQARSLARAAAQSRLHARGARQFAGPDLALCRLRERRFLHGSPLQE